MAKLTVGAFLLLGFVLTAMAGAAGMIIAGVGPGSMERAVAALASAVAGLGLVIAGAIIRGQKPTDSR